MSSDLGEGLRMGRGLRPGEEPVRGPEQARWVGWPGNAAGQRGEPTWVVVAEPLDLGIQHVRDKLRIWGRSPGWAFMGSATECEMA